MKRPMNPFISFYMKVYHEMRGRPVTVIAKTAGRRWRAMSMTQRLAYYQKCGHGSNWGQNMPMTSAAARLAVRGRNVPCVSRSPFINFFVKMYREEGKNVPVTVIARSAGHRWSIMSIAEKRPFYEGACRFGQQRPRY